MGRCGCGKAVARADVSREPDSERGSVIEIRSFPNRFAVRLLYPVLALCLIPLAARAAVQKLIWPLEAHIAPTSSFCEYRPMRYHGGIDLSTGGHIGDEIVAVEDGWVWRVRVSPYGYGRVIYLRLRDGHTAVYAHLSAFEPDLESIVRKEQYANEQYTVDLFLKPNQVRYRKGQVIGRTGATGSGAPHLHFEIRDADNRPINPYEHGLTLRDYVPPTMGSIAFIPLDKNARANGSVSPLTIPLADYGGVWTSRREPVLWGRIGVALMVWDRDPQTRYRMGVYGTTMDVDGKEVFHRRYDVMSLATQRLSVFDRNFTLLADGDGRYYNQFIPPGNTLGFYGDLTTGAGVLICGDGEISGEETLLDPGRHEISFTATDFSHNTAHGRMIVRIGRESELNDLTVTDEGGSRRLVATLLDSAYGTRVAFSATPGGDAPWSALPESVLPEREGGVIRASAPLPNSGLVRVDVQDTLGGLVSKTLDISSLRKPPRYRLETTWERDWLGISLTASRVLREEPTIRAFWPEEVIVRLDPKELSPGLYETDVVPDTSWPRNYRVRVLSGSGRPTVVSQWTDRHEIMGKSHIVSGHDSLRTNYLGVVGFDDTFPDSGFVEVRAEDFDSTIAIRGRVLGPDGGTYQDIGATAEFGRGILTQPTFVRIKEEPLPDYPGLIPVGVEYRFEPQDVPLAGDATLMIDLPDSVSLDRIALYGLSPKEATFLAGPETSSDRTIRARVPSLYTVGVYRDTIPPVVQITSPRSDRVVRARRPLFYAIVRDRGSGFAHSDDAMEMRIDGRWVPAAYDPENDCITYRPPDAMPIGRHTVVVHARDQVGNERSDTVTFTVE